MMVVLIISPCQNWGANVEFEEQQLNFSNTISLMVINHCLLAFITISFLLLISDICSSILTFGQTRQKWPILTTKKVNLRPKKKSLFLKPYWHVLFAKNGVQIGQIWPVWLHLYFTSGYRGFPPCTLSQHPDSRETGYSNVLASISINQHQSASMSTNQLQSESISISQNQSASISINQHQSVLINICNWLGNYI